MGMALGLLGLAVSGAIGGARAVSGVAGGAGAAWVPSFFEGVAQAAGPVWRDTEQLRVRLFDHAFTRAMLNDARCEVRVRLYFDAPAEGYREPTPARNHYRFLAEVKLYGGKKFVSELFDNTEPGARVYAFSHDTSSEGCWAAQEHELLKVDVHGCRGALCKPQRFH